MSCRKGEPPPATRHRCCSAETYWFALLGKNRCVNAGTDAPCERCAKHGTNCVFEQPATSKTVDEERIGRMEEGAVARSSVELAEAN